MKLFFLLFSIFIFSSCGRSMENMLKDNTSEIREYMCVGESNNISSSLILGKRETNYIVNGYSTDLIEFGVLSFKFKSAKEDIGVAKYVLFVGTEKFEGDLQENPFDYTLVADIQKIVDVSKKIVARIICDNWQEDIELSAINTSWKVGYNDVYKVIAKNMKSEIEAFVYNNTFEGEVYIKIINDEDINVSDYYWYVNIIGRGGKRLSAIVSPNSKEILAKNCYL